jgi:acetyl esterase/lipase
MDRNNHLVLRLLSGLAVIAGLLALGPESTYGNGTTTAVTLDDATTPTDCFAPVGVVCSFGIPYGDGPSQTLDAYWSTKFAGQPSVVIVHGGGWSAGNSTDYYPEAAYLAQNGFAVFSLNYTLSSPGNPSWPQVLTDVETGTKWVRDNAHLFGADGSRIGAYGGSAGGHLVALLDVIGSDHGIPITTAVSWSGPMDLRSTYRHSNDYVRDAITQLLGCAPRHCPDDEDVIASPDAHVTPDDGSLLFFNAQDELVSIQQAHLMNRVLRDVGVRHHLVVFNDTNGHASQLECHPARILGVEGPAIDGAIRWLGNALTGRPWTPTGTFCG